MTSSRKLPKTTIDAVATSLSELDRALAALAKVMVPGRLSATAEGASSTTEAIKVTLETCVAIDIAGGASLPPPPGCLGVIAADAAVLSSIEAVNQAKAAFRDVCSAVRPRAVRVVSQRMARPNQRTHAQTIRLILSEVGREDLNMLAAYRRFPVLEGQPRQVFFCRPGNRAVYKVNRDEILESLSRMDHPAAGTDQQRLRALAEDETHLALVKAHYERVRANVVFDGLDGHGRHRIMVCCELPIVYPISRRGALPIVKYPLPRERRADTITARVGTVCKERFLESLPVHRYLPSHRGAANRCSQGA